VNGAHRGQQAGYQQCLDNCVYLAACPTSLRKLIRERKIPIRFVLVPVCIIIF
jgi:hypothetical protein